MLCTSKIGNCEARHSRKAWFGWPSKKRVETTNARPLNCSDQTLPSEHSGKMMIAVNGVSLALPIGTVLEDIELSVEKGEIVTLVGPNGAGKSSLLKLIIGLVAPSSGIVTKSPDLKIGYLPQRISLNQTMPMTVDRFLRLRSSASDSNAMEVRDLTGVTALAPRQMHALSFGQLQRVLLARALLGSPDLLVLDEPTQSLDRNGIRNFYRIIRNFKAETGCAVLKTSHELDILVAYADRVVCMNKRIVCQGPPNIVAKSREFLSMFGGEVDGVLAIFPAAENRPPAAWNSNHDH